MPTVKALAVLSLVALTAQAPKDFTGSHLGYHDVRRDKTGRLVPWFAEDEGASYRPRPASDVALLARDAASARTACRITCSTRCGSPARTIRAASAATRSRWRSRRGTCCTPTRATKPVADMRLMADYWLAHGLSPSDERVGADAVSLQSSEPHSGRYDGDMRAGPGVLQPDKAGSFRRGVADALPNHRRPPVPRRRERRSRRRSRQPCAKATSSDSPWPFRVDAATGATATVRPGFGRYDDGRSPPLATEYTANWTGTLRLFDGLAARRQDRPDRPRPCVDAKLAAACAARHEQLGAVLRRHRRDVEHGNQCRHHGAYLLHHPENPSAAPDARRILDWVERTFANEKYGVLASCRSTSRPRTSSPGNSHTARHASVELLYAERTGDWSRKEMQVRRLNWATYTVDADGKNKYPGDDIWLTDGYGDYVRHYLRAMASSPDLAPDGQNHLLRSSSVIQTIEVRRRPDRLHQVRSRSTERLKLGAWTPGTSDRRHAALVGRHACRRDRRAERHRDDRTRRAVGSCARQRGTRGSMTYGCRGSPCSALAASSARKPGGLNSRSMSSSTSTQSFPGPEGRTA